MTGSSVSCSPSFPVRRREDGGGKDDWRRSKQNKTSGHGTLYCTEDCHEEFKNELVGACVSWYKGLATVRRFS